MKTTYNVDPHVTHMGHKVGRGGGREKGKKIEIHEVNQAEEDSPAPPPPANRHRTTQQANKRRAEEQSEPTKQGQAQEQWKNRTRRNKRNRVAKQIHGVNRARKRFLSMPPAPPPPPPPLP